MLKSRREVILQSISMGAFALSGVQANANENNQSGRLVLVFLRGAYDGLSMLVPHGDPHYALLRPTIGIAKPDGTPKTALKLDDTFGLQVFEKGLELGYAFQKNDRVRMELYRLNKDAFVYLSQLVNLLFSDGGLFSPPPQNPTSNIRVINGKGEVLGYFVVSPVLTRTVVIAPK